MAFSWGAALKQWGSDIPTLGAAFDQIGEKKRKYKREDIEDQRAAEQEERLKLINAATLEDKNLQLGKLRDEIAKRDEGRKKAYEYNQTQSDLEKYQSSKPIPNTDRVNDIGDFSAPSTDYGKDLKMEALAAMKPEDRLRPLVPYGSYTPEVKSMIDYELANKKIDKTSYGKSGGKAFNRVGARADFNTPENREETKRFLLENKDTLGLDDAYVTELARQVDTGYAYDVNELIRQQSAKILGIEPEVKKQWELVPPKAAQAGASSESSTRKKAETEKDLAEEGVKTYTGTESSNLARTGMLVDKLKILRNALAANNIDIFDRTLFGAFKNPEIKTAMDLAQEITGREQSGAVIGAKEWDRFGSELVSRKNLLTENGRKAALNNLDDFIRRELQQGKNLTANKDWYQQYTKESTEMAGKLGGETKIIGGKPYKKVAGGWQLIK